jgi:hypothetical protein
LDIASVSGVQKLKPCGTAVAGKLLPREKPLEEFVPRVVMTQSDRCERAGRDGWPVIAMSSTQPLKSAGPLGLS